MKTSVLENFRFEPGRAEFTLDGQPISIHGDARSPALATLSELYAHALADYQVHRGNETPLNGILARVGSWFSRFWRNRAQLGSEPIGRPSPYAAPAHSPWSPATPVAKTPHAFASHLSPATPQIERVNSEIVRLRSIFADEKGVHVIWQETRPHAEGTPTSHAQINLTYGSNSELARRLHRCFEQLSLLGYKVIGAELLERGSAATANANPIESPRNAEHHRPDSAQSAGLQSSADVQSASAEKQAAGAKFSLRDLPSAQESAEAAPPEIVMRLHAPSAEHPSRALVSPAENSEKTEVLLAPERVLRALHTAASSSRPIAERLTYLRCSRGEKGLRIVAVGFGEAAERTPGRWADAKTWWNNDGQKLAADSSAQTASCVEAVSGELGPIFVTGSSPLQQQRNPKSPADNPSAKSASVTPEPG